MHNLRTWGKNMRNLIVGAVGLVLVVAGPEPANANPPATSLRITQLMYHPPALTAAEIGAGATNSDEFEYIELKNLGSFPVDLTGLRFTEGIFFDFPEMSLGGGEVALVVGDEPAFQIRYGSNSVILGGYIGRLSNSGERIVLLDAAGTPIHDFIYDDNWYEEETDGGGYPLEVLDTEGDYSDASNWLPSLTLIGVPGFHPDAAAAIPEPSTLALAALGFLTLLGWGRRRRG